MSKPSVSVIIPTYNRLAYLREALDSVLAQTYRDFEVIVVDDGSSVDIEAGITDHPAQAKVIKQPHQGPAAARNHGLEHASANTSAFLDSDDLWQPNKLETFMAAMAAQPDVNIFYGPMRPINEQGKPVHGRTKPCHDGWISEKLFCSSFVHVPTVVCRKKTVLDANGFNHSLPVCEDYDLWLRLSVYEPFALIKEPYALRRLHSDRLSKENMSRNLVVKAKVLQDFYEANRLNGRLDPAIAEARLARVLFAASRASFQNGQYEQAVHLCRESRRYGKSPIRTTPLLARARTMALFRNGRDKQEHVPSPTVVGSELRGYTSSAASAGDKD